MAEAQMMDTEGPVGYDDDMMDAEEYHGGDYDIELVDEVQEEHVDVDIKVVDMDEGDMQEPVDNDQDMLYDFQSPLPSAGFDGFKNIDPTVSGAFSTTTQQTEVETTNFGQDQTAHFSSDLLGSSIIPGTVQPSEEGQFADAAGDFSSEAQSHTVETTETHVETTETHVETTSHEESDAVQASTEQNDLEGDAADVEENRSRLTSQTLDNEVYPPAADGEEQRPNEQEQEPTPTQIQGEPVHNASPAASNAEVERIPPIVCYYDENELCLYPKDFYSSKDETFSFDGRPYPADYLLPDMTSYSKSFDTIFSGLRDLLEIGDDDELRLVFEELGLTFCEDNRLAQDFTLADVHRLYTRLAGDGEEAMIVTLQTEPRITKRYSELLEAAGSGKKLDDVSPHAWASDHDGSPKPHADVEGGVSAQDSHQSSHHHSPEDAEGVDYAGEFEQGLIPDDDVEENDEDDAVLLEVSHEEQDVEHHVEHHVLEHDGAPADQQTEEEQDGDAEEREQLLEEFLEDEETTETEFRSAKYVVSVDTAQAETNEESSANANVLTTTSVEQVSVEEVEETTTGAENQEDYEQQEDHPDNTDQIIEEPDSHKEHAVDDGDEVQELSEQQQQQDDEEWNELLPVDDNEDGEDGEAVGEYPQDQYQELSHDGDEASEEQHATDSEFEHHAAHADMPLPSYETWPIVEGDNGEDRFTPPGQQQLTEEEYAAQSGENPYESDTHQAVMAAMYSNGATNIDDGEHEVYYDNQYEQYEDAAAEDEDDSGDVLEVAQVTTEEHIEHVEHVEIIEHEDSDAYEEDGEAVVDSPTHLAASSIGDSKRGREDDVLEDDAQHAKRRKSTAPEEI